MAETLKRACGAPGTTWVEGILSLTEAPERLVPKATVPRATPRDCVTCPSKPEILILSRGSTRWDESVFGSMVTVVPVSTIDSYSSLSKTALLKAACVGSNTVQTPQMLITHLSWMVASETRATDGAPQIWKSCEMPGRSEAADRLLHIELRF